MKVALVATLIAAILAAAFAKQYKLNGHWTRGTCTCTGDATAFCDDLWQSDYPNVMYGGLVVLPTGGTTTGWTSNNTSPLQSRTLSFAYTDPEFIIAALPALPAILPLTGYWCHGWMGKPVTCESPDQQTQYCTVEFDCMSGDCVTTIVTLNMRSIMFPILGGLIGIVWLLLSFLKGLPLAIIAMALAVTIFVLSLFLLVAPNVFPALMAMAFAAVAFSANKGEGQWEIKLAIVSGIFVFLAFAGLNALAASNQNYFDATLEGFNQGCFRYYGLDQKSARCAQYLLFVGFDGFLIMMLVPLLVIVLIGRLGDGDK